MVKIKREKGEYNVDSDGIYDKYIPRAASLQGRSAGPTRRSKKGGWTEEEDNCLAKAVTKYRGKNWKKIAEYVPGRKDIQCLHRWQKVLNPELVKGPWAKEEDDCIMELVEKHGCRKWCVIAEYLPGRIGKQCRERWLNHLDPAIKKDLWTEEEESILFYYHQIYGNKWAKIAGFLPGRTSNAIKNHWNCSMKKKLDSCSPSHCAMDICGTTSPDICSPDAEPEQVRVKVERQSFAGVTSVNQGMRLEYSADACSTDLVLGLAYGEEIPPSVKFDGRGTIAGGVTRGACGDNSNNANAQDPLLASSSDISLEQSALTKSDFGPLKHVFSISSGIIQSPKRSRDYASGVVGLRFDKESDTSCLSPSTSGFDVDIVQVGKKIQRISPHAEDMGNSCLPCRSPQPKDMATSVENKGFPSMDHRIRHPNSPLCYYTPPKIVQSIYVNSSSPESVLRNSARSFKSTPSIIRKRTFGKAGSTNFSSLSDTPAWMMSCTHDREDVSCAAFLKMKQGFFSSVHKTETSGTVKSLGRCLEFAFSMEKDPTTFKSGNPISASASPNVNLGENTELPP